MKNELEKELSEYADSERSVLSQRYFKTAKGEYGEGDVFVGIITPLLRGLSKKYRDLPLADCRALLQSPIHEYRALALMVLCLQFTKADSGVRQRIYNLYLNQLSAGNINNWDLVDISAGHVVGEYNLATDRKILFKLAQSDSVWERRVSIISTSVYINRGDVATTLQLSELLLNDKHDLIHKAVGWMLREVGKRVSEAVLIDFLRQHQAAMPHTTWRYAIERLTKEQIASI
jgi:3-methyladenine DNA glycosylase AlkD